MFKVLGFGVLGGWVRVGVYVGPWGLRYRKH